MERRAFPRVNANLTLEYQTSEGWAPLGETFNISEGGFGIKVKEKIPPHNRLRLKTIDNQIQALVHAAWMNRSQNRCGIQIDEIDHKSKNRLQKFLTLNPEYVQFKIQNIALTDILINNFISHDLINSSKAIENILHFPLSISEQNKRKKIFTLLDTLAQKAETIVSHVQDKATVKKIRNIFREIIGPWIYESIIMERATKKPRGYPGDYALLEMIYDNKAISPNFGKYFDEYFLQNPYAIAVRNRKDLMREYLTDLFTNSKKDLKILNIASGSCREIKEFLPHIQKNKFKVYFNCVDHDSEALAFAKKTLQICSSNLQIDFTEANVLSFIKKPEYYSKLLGLNDLIYTIGLADYLPDKIFSALLTFLINLVKKNGNLIIAHKDISQYKPLPPNWYCDWHFVPRNEADVISLIRNATCYPIEIKVEREYTKKIIFFRVKRK